MFSISGNNWEESFINQRIIDKIKIDHNFSDIVAKIIALRKYDKLEIDSINENIEVINPFLRNNDFIKAQIILNNSIKNNEKIFILGDYDVDGCVSTSLLINFLKNFNVKIEYYIPNRFSDGYGATIKLIKKIGMKKPNLVIMLDCGSNANESIKFLKSKNIKTIVIDHHEIYKPYPSTECLINPKKICNYNEYDYFCTSALTYFLIDKIIKEKKIKYSLDESLSYVLLATISDVMPLRKLNRIIANNVIRKKILDNTYLFKKILEYKKLKKKIEVEDLGFLVGPILNAAGRLEDSNQVVNLLTSDNLKPKNLMIEKLISLNNKRKNIENLSIKEMNLNKIKNKRDYVLVEFEKMINEGIIGIIASRLKEYFNKPTVILTKSSNIYKASARSTYNFNIGKYIKKGIDNNIIISGGGHNLAAGFTIKKEKIKDFKKFINDSFKKNNQDLKKNYISKISFKAINTDFLSDIRKLSPFGENNPNPIFLLEKVKIKKPKIVSNKFVSFFIKSKYGKLLPGISFNYLESKINENLINNKNEMNLIVQIKENHWNNKKNLQLIVLDLMVLPNKA